MRIERLGPYRITGELGRGGMGTVYRGVNSETGEPAAVKLLSVTLAEDRDFRQRFELEIDTLKKLHHPNIVRLFGFGEQDGLLYYVMELIDGSSLETELERGRRFDWREVTQIGIETCQALRHAHDRGVIHRDIKPGNLLLTAGGHVKLSDFGIARLFGDNRATSPGTVMGTAEFMAPEQVEGRPVDGRTDLYSLGVVFWVLLTRRRLFRADSLPQLLEKQRVERPELVSRYADVPAELEQIVAQLLEKDPQQRVSSPALLGRRLAAMRHGLSLGPEAAQTDVEDEVPPEVAAMPPTRPLDEPPEAPPPAGLAKTRATSSFAPPEESPPGGPQESAGRFTTVGEEGLDRLDIPKTRHALISPQTWVLAVGLILVGLAVWYFLQPPSADSLYAKIVEKTSDDTIASLLRTEDDVREFLTLYPSDSRCKQLREYRTEIELYWLQRKFERRARGLAGTENLLPIERAYLEAINYLRLDPEQGMARLQALIDLYGRRADTAGPTGQCLELARRRLARLRDQSVRQNARHLALVQDRLDEADRLSGADPRRAETMYRAVIELYDHKPWAAAAVSRARAALAGKTYPQATLKPDRKRP